VSGLPTGARERKLTLMFVGSQTLLEQVSSLLKILGKNIISCREVRSGQLIKAVNNTINIVALCQILPPAPAAGIFVDALEQVSTQRANAVLLGTTSSPLG
jgi:3-hydroxyisobutyrate dehydrogenase-like beta-hydroxyacid dehydrogenase